MHPTDFTDPPDLDPCSHCEERGWVEVPDPESEDTNPTMIKTVCPCCESNSRYTVRGDKIIYEKREPKKRDSMELLAMLSALASRHPPLPPELMSFGRQRAPKELPGGLFNWKPRTKRRERTEDEKAARRARKKANKAKKKKRRR